MKPTKVKLDGKHLPQAEIDKVVEKTLEDIAKKEGKKNAK